MSNKEINFLIILSQNIIILIEINKIFDFFSENFLGDTSVLNYKFIYS